MHVWSLLRIVGFKNRVAFEPVWDLYSLYLWCSSDPEGYQHYFFKTHNSNHGAVSRLIQHSPLNYNDQMRIGIYRHEFETNKNWCHEHICQECRAAGEKGAQRLELTCGTVRTPTAHIEEDFDRNTS